MSTHSAFFCQSVALVRIRQVFFFFFYPAEKGNKVKIFYLIIITLSKFL